MISHVRKAAGWVLYPWLLTLYPIIYLYSINLGLVREDDIIEVVLTTAALTTAAVFMGYFLTRDLHKAGAITGMITLVVLTYGHLYNTLESSRLAQTLLLPAMGILALIAVVMILRSKGLWQQLTLYLNVIFAVLLFMPLLKVIQFHTDPSPADITAQVNPLERVVKTPKVTNSPDRPDIYYIILDAYSSNSLWMQDYGYDNSPFTAALEERGFFVAYDSEANYGATMLSMSSSLNMRYITPDDRNNFDPEKMTEHLYLRSLIANNEVADELKPLGYSYIYIMSGFLVPSAMADVNVAFYPDGAEYFSGDEFNAGEGGANISWTYKQPFWPFFLKTTMLRSVASHFDTQKSGEPYPIFAPEVFHATLDELERISEMEEATFTLAHIVKPHWPIQFDREGNLLGFEVENNDPRRAEYFFNELTYLNSRVLDLVDNILAASDVPPIIIIQGDHGSDLGHESGPYCLYDFEILNAFYLPHGENIDGLHTAIQPVNSFRMIFNNYFAGEYPYLPAAQYITPNKCLYDDLLTMGPYYEDDRLNAALGDHILILYNGVGKDSSPEFHLYSVTEDGYKGEHLYTITCADIAPYIGAPPTQNTIIVREGAMAFSALTSGEFQFNIGPDAQGREWAVVVDALPAESVHGYQVGTQ
ncbi:MAG: hypothetical protein JXB30_16265 [Anaerolineae bacterium]|nr:hypothetical protein [Anaerolineae bacterium]